jgi:hypothetical protein
MDDHIRRNTPSAIPICACCWRLAAGARASEAVARAMVADARALRLGLIERREMAT